VSGLSVAQFDLNRPWGTPHLLKREAR
jgi:hypothetical protein